MRDVGASTVDLRRLLGPVKDQGDRGTCVAFASTACHEASACDVPDYAEEAVFWGALEIEDGDGGISYDAAMQALSTQGQPDSTEWPYDGCLDHLADGYGPPSTAEACRPWKKCDLRRVPLNVDDFRELLSADRPVTIMIPMFEELYEPENGTIVVPENPTWLDGNHAISLVGYDDTKAQFLFRNSWGRDWGDEGHARISYEFVACHTRDAASIASPPSEVPEGANSVPHFVAATASAAHRAALAHPSGPLHNVLLQFPAAGLDSALAEAYPFKNADETSAQALAEIVRWWQYPTVPSGPAKRFNHGSRLRSRDGEWDQIPQVIEAIQNDPRSTKGHATLQSHRPGYADTNGHPSLCDVFFALRWEDERCLLDVSATFRKLELRYWWIVNVHELASLQRLVIEELSKGAKRISAEPGDIATFAFRAVVSPEGAAPEVAIHALDRAHLFRPDDISDLVATLSKKPQKHPKKDREKSRYRVWDGFLRELMPSEKMNEDGFPVCLDGLGALAGQVKILSETSVGLSIKSLAAHLSDLLDENKAMVAALDESRGKPIQEREYKRWREACRSIVANALQIVAERLHLPYPVS